MMLGEDPLQHTSIYRNREDSDDSDGEGGMGNVNRLIMRPPGHSGKAKRGHLCFDASFETGNLGHVDLVNEFEYDLYVRPDTCSPRLRMWFNFTVDNVRLDQRVIFNIVNISKSRNLYNATMTPIVKSTTRQKWQHIPKPNVFFQQSPMHRGQYVLSFAFTFDREDEVFQFALAPPYSYTKLQTFLTVIETRGNIANFRREQIAESVQKRKIDLLTIGEPRETGSRAGAISKPRRVVVIMARSHPGDSSASFACQGLIEFLISSHPVAATLRESITFKVVPMLNPDGVFLGNYRSNLMGFDLNRSWNVTSQFVHPTIRGVLDTIVEIDNNKELQLDFVLDLHGNSTLTGCFVNGNTYDDVYRYERHIVFPKILATVADDYNANNTLFNADANKAGAARRYLCGVLSDRVNCYSIEISLFGYRLQTANLTVIYSADSYMRCGRNIVRAFFEYYRATGVVPTHSSSPGRSPRAHGHSRLGRHRHGHHRKRLARRRLRNTRCATSAAAAESASAREFQHTAMVQLHFQHLYLGSSEGYDSDVFADTSRYDLPSVMLRSQPVITKRGDAVVPVRHDRRSTQRCSPPPAIFIAMPEPSLTIIDFNLDAHDDLTLQSNQAISRSVKQ